PATIVAAQPLGGGVAAAAIDDALVGAEQVGAIDQQNELVEGGRASVVPARLKRQAGRSQAAGVRTQTSHAMRFNDRMVNAVPGVGYRLKTLAANRSSSFILAGVRPCS